MFYPVSASHVPAFSIQYMYSGVRVIDAIRLGSPALYRSTLRSVCVDLFPTGQAANKSKYSIHVSQIADR